MSSKSNKTGVVYKSLAFLGFPEHQIGSDVSVWSEQGRMKLTRVKKRNYLVTTLCYRGKEKRFYVHRLMLLAFVGPCPKGMQCRHLNGVPNDNRLENLKWGTPKKNQRDRVRHGTHTRGTQNGRAKLTEDDVRTIRKKHATGKYTFADLGREYGVHYSVIADLVRRLTWKFVD